MTRYAAGHKAETRAHLLEVARHEFRRHGFERVSIDNLMKAAGLTRGGFYAHFDSKEALVREVLRVEPGLLTQLRAANLRDDPRAEAIRAFDAYLDPARREQLIDCALVAHAIDALRGGEERTALYAQQVGALIDAVRDVVDGERDAERDAILTVVIAVGAAMLSSASTDGARADEIERTCRDEIRQRLARTTPVTTRDP